MEEGTTIIGALVNFIKLLIMHALIYALLSVIAIQKGRLEIIIDFRPLFLLRLRGFMLI